MSKLRFKGRLILIVGISLCLSAPGYTYFEDLCVGKDHKIQACIQPPDDCRLKPPINSVCLAQLGQAVRKAVQQLPGRSMLHATAWAGTNPRFSSDQ